MFVIFQVHLMCLQEASFLFFPNYSYLEQWPRLNLLDFIFWNIFEVNIQVSRVLMWDSCPCAFVHDHPDPLPSLVLQVAQCVSTGKRHSSCLSYLAWLPRRSYTKGENWFLHRFRDKNGTSCNSSVCVPLASALLPNNFWTLWSVLALLDWEVTLQGVNWDEQLVRGVSMNIPVKRSHLWVSTRRFIRKMDVNAPGRWKVVIGDQTQTQKTMGKTSNIVLCIEPFGFLSPKALRNFFSACSSLVFLCLLMLLLQPEWHLWVSADSFSLNKELSMLKIYFSGCRISILYITQLYLVWKTI